MVGLGLFTDSIEIHYHLFTSIIFVSTYYDSFTPDNWLPITWKSLYFNPSRCSWIKIFKFSIFKLLLLSNQINVEKQQTVALKVQIIKITSTNFFVLTPQYLWRPRKLISPIKLLRSYFQFSLLSVIHLMLLKNEKRFGKLSSLTPWSDKYFKWHLLTNLAHTIWQTRYGTGKKY